VTDAFTGEKLAVLERQIDEWLAELYANHDHIVAVDRSPDDDVRWFVRMRGGGQGFHDGVAHPRSAHLALRDIRNAGT